MEENTSSNQKELVAATVLQIVASHMQSICDATIEIGDESDDEEENVVWLHAHSSWKNKATRIENYVEITVQNYSEREFQSHFRLTYAAYEALESTLGPALSLEQGLPVQKQLLTILWLLATPDSFRSIGDRFDLSKGGVYRCFKRVITELNRIANIIIKWPVNTEKPHIKSDFKKFGGLSGVIGAVDGTFIEIKAPRRHPHVYTCRKSFYAMQLQAIATPNLKFIDVFTGYPGSVGDLRVFVNSNIYKNITTSKEKYFEPGEYILGDKAYPTALWCIAPYINRGNLSEAEINFNEKHAKTRQVVERAFALLFGRYRRLKYLDMNRTDLTPATILAACVLHNICLDHNDMAFDQVAIAEGEAHITSQQQNNQESSGNSAENDTDHHNISNEGLAFRNGLAQDLLRLQ